MINSVEKTSVPVSSRMHQFVDKADFSECFHARKTIAGEVNASLVFKKLLESPPPMVMAVVKVRDFFFKLLGLKTSNDVPNPIKFVDLPVNRDKPVVSDMEMNYLSPEEVIWGVNDKHLDFAVSVYVINSQNKEKNDCQIYVSTILHYNNAWGRVYFTFIRAVHAWVIRAMMRTLLEKL